jgi:molecular chaperone IbpA
MTINNLSIFNKLKPMTVGFDDMFDHFERMFDNEYIPNFPFYNIIKTGDNKYCIELALAGYSKKDIDITLENSLLSVKSKAKEVSEEKDTIIHKGISKRYFSKSFTISDDVEVKGAELKDGLLKIDLEKIVPEHKKPKTISIK